MTNFSMDFPIRDETCKKGAAEHMGFAYYGRSQSVLKRQQFGLGERALSDPIEALAEADRSLVLESSESNKFYAAAATVLRLCMNHDSPQFEVVVNSIAATHTGVTFELIGNDYASLDNINASKTTFNATASAVNGRHNNFLGWRSGGVKSALYLPREDFSAIRETHTGIIVARGGNTNPLPIGLLGGEQLVETQMMPDNRPD